MIDLISDLVVLCPHLLWQELDNPCHQVHPPVCLLTWACPRWVGITNCLEVGVNLEGAALLEDQDPICQEECRSSTSYDRDNKCLWLNHREHLRGHRSWRRCRGSCRVEINPHLNMAHTISKDSRVNCFCYFSSLNVTKGCQSYM